MLSPRARSRKPAIGSWPWTSACVSSAKPSRRRARRLSRWIRLQRKWQSAVRLPARGQQAAELLGILDQHVLPGKRLRGDQAREPETQAGDTQYGLPQLGLRRGE